MTAETDSAADSASGAPDESGSALEALMMELEGDVFVWERALAEEIVAAAEEAEAAPAEQAEAIAYWPFDGTGGDAHALHDALMPDDARPAGTGKIAGALDLAGWEAGLMVPDSAAFALAEGAFALWVKAAPNGNPQTLLSKGAYATEGAAFFRLDLTAGGQIAFTLVLDGETYLISTQTILPETWHHVAVSFGIGTGLRLSLNGETAAWADYRGGLEGIAGPLVFGARPAQTGPVETWDSAYHGALDEAVLLSGPADEAVIAELFEAGLDGAALPLAGGDDEVWF